MSQDNSKERLILGKPAETIDLSDNDTGVWLSAKGGADTVIGSDFNDLLDGGTGADTLHGGDGNDTLKGSHGNDILEGGAGADTFIFGGGSRSDNDADIVLDYENGTDRLIIKAFAHDDRIADVRLVEDLLLLSDDRLSVSADGGDVLIEVTEGDRSYTIRLKDFLIDGLPSEAPGLPEMQIVVTTGQSLAAGVTSPGNPSDWSNDPVDPERALEMDFGVPLINDIGWGQVPADLESFEGLKPMEVDGRRTPADTVIPQILGEYDATGETAPTFLHFNNARGGKSILELMVGSDLAFTSVDDALAATVEGDVFAVREGDTGLWDYYVNHEGAADYYSSRNGGTTIFDNFVAQLELAVETARDEGYALTDQLVVSFIQGQSDSNTNHPVYDYSYLLETYYAKIDAEADRIFGKDVEVLMGVTQHGGFGDRRVAIEQLEAITENDGIFLAGVEYEEQSSNPEKPFEGGAHLSPEGYSDLGLTIGAALYDAMTGAPDAPILMETVTWQDAQTLIVSFSGVEGALVVDTSIYAEDTNGVTSPQTLGFELYDDRGKVRSDLPEIVSATVTGETEVTLVFDVDVTGNDYRLYLGRIEGSEQETEFRVGLGSPLRDSEITTSAPQTGTDPAITEPIYEYAPVQYIDLSGYDSAL